MQSMMSLVRSTSISIICRNRWPLALVPSNSGISGNRCFAVLFVNLFLCILIVSRYPPLKFRGIKSNFVVERHCRILPIVYQFFFSRNLESVLHLTKQRVSYVPLFKSVKCLGNKYFLSRLFFLSTMHRIHE